MQIRSTHNGGVVLVNETFGKRLIEGGGWEAVVQSAPTKPSRKPRTKNAPEKEPKTEE